MEYSILPLKFDTPIHFGAAEQGGDLTACGVEYTADTVISAILHELDHMEEIDSLNKMNDLLDNRKILFSDFLPYAIDDKTGEINLYLPKPIMIGAAQSLKSSLEETREQATKMKKQKKVSFVRCSELSVYVDGLRTGNMKYLQSADFYDGAIIQRVFIRNRDSSESADPMPYFVGAHKFRDTAGMYLVVGVESREDLEFIRNVLNYVGLSGIGGKRSSGYGKFHVVDDDTIKSSADAKELLILLNQDKADVQMSISTLLPDTEEISILNTENAWYKLKARSGFISGMSGEAAQKKNSIYMVASGSCLPERIAGTKAILGKIGEKKIIRYGYGMFVGV